MNAVVQHETTAVVDAHTAAHIKAQVNRIQEVMRAVMKEGAHFGVIPGTDKPTLYKAGSEVLLSTFRIAVDPEVEDLSVGDEIRYRVRAVGRHMASDMIVGVGIGEASSSEEKYKWRRAVCDDEYEDTSPDQRRIKYVRARNGTIYRNKQVRAEPADYANTILKMAKKRAQIDLCLTALAASDIFTQDLEDMPEHLRPAAADEPATDRDAPKASEAPEVATDAQIKLIRKKLEQAGLDESEMLHDLGIDALEGMPFEKVNACMDWLKKAAKK